MRFGVDSSRKLGVMGEDPQNSSFGEENPVESCFGINACYLSFKVGTSGGTPPPGTGGGRQEITPLTKTIHFKGFITTECVCLYGRDDGGVGKCRGNTTGGLGCDSDGYQLFIFTRSYNAGKCYTQQDIDYSELVNVTGCEKKLPDKQIDESFTLDSLLDNFDPDDDVSSPGCLYVPASPAAHAMCKARTTEIFIHPEKWACTFSQKLLAKAALKCGAGEPSDAIFAGTAGGQPAKWTCVDLSTPGVKECLLDEMDCGGDMGVQAAILVNFFNTAGDDMMPPPMCYFS